MTGNLTGFRAPKPGWRLLTLASLGLNLFLGAMLAAAYQRPPPLPMPDRYVERVASALPAEDAQRLRHAFDEQRPRYDMMSRDYRAAREKVRVLAQADPLDLPALRSALEDARAKRRQFGEVTEETLLSILPDLPPASRARLAGKGL